MKTLLILSVLLTATVHAVTECDDLSTVGWNSAVRTSSDPAGWSIIVSGKPIPCDGIVSQWSYWALASQPFRAVVWRPTSVATEFRVIGINEIPAGAIPAVVFTVPRDERIEVQKGDVIGFSWSDNSPRTTWTVGGDGAAEIRWFRLADASDLAVGDTRIATGVQGRSWSISALLQSTASYCSPNSRSCRTACSCTCEC